MTRTLDPNRITDHFDRMYRAAWAMCGSPHDAEDLVQETYARLLTKPRAIRERDEIGYLLTALRNTYINQRRTAARRPAIAEPRDEYEIPDTDHSYDPDERARANEVLGYLSSLPDDLGAAIVAVDVVGLSPLEAASSLGVDDRVLAHRLHRARVSVARRLAPERFAGSASCR